MLYVTKFSKKGERLQIEELRSQHDENRVFSLIACESNTPIGVVMASLHLGQTIECPEETYWQWDRNAEEAELRFEKHSASTK